MRKQVVLAGLLALAGFCADSTALAQLPRYRAPYRAPAGNPLPSQLNYFRSDVGLLDPYNAIVAPQQRFSDDIRSLNSRQRLLQAEIAAPAQLRQTEAASTGTGSVFMNRSHFFPAPNQRR